MLSKDAPDFGEVTYTYDLTDGMKTGYHYELQTDETGTTKTIYDTQNRVVEVTTSSEETTETVRITYYDNGARKQVTYGDGSSESYTYYGNNMVKSVINRLPDDTITDVFTYEYDGAGDLTRKTERSNGVERGATIYTYDEQNRLKTVTNPDGSTTAYTYDKAGNRATETTVENEIETGKTYTYNGRNQLLSVVQAVEGVTAVKTDYTYDANGNQLTETQTTYAVATESGEDETVTVLTNTYDLRNQLVKSVTEEAVIDNTYNAAGYRVEKSVTKNGSTKKTYFLSNGNNVIMEADEDGVTAKNTYGGPLLLRTEFDDAAEITYEYMYNAHGDVVTLISDGEVVATYCYDSFGNILEQTGEVDNSILYAGYQYDEETGLYYINARMYDPVAARFLQADTYLGATNDPLSLNLYTYCLNNPHKYVDPSGHFAITVAGVLAALRIGVSLFSGWMSAKAEYDRQVAEGDNNTDWTSVLFVGAANAGVSFFSFGAGSGAAMAGTGFKAVVKHVGKAMIREAAIGALTDAGIETTRQLITGIGITNLEYDRITEAGVCGGIAGGVGTLAGAGLQGLLNTRVAKSAIEKLDTLAHKGAGAIKRAFGELATDNSGAVDLDAFKNVGKGGSSSTLFDTFGVQPGRNVDLNNPSAPNNRSYITYVFRNESDEIVYVGRASGNGNPVQVMEGRISKGHDHFKPGDSYEIVATQTNKLANQGAEEFFILGYQEMGMNLENITPSLSYRSDRVGKTMNKIEAFFEDLFGK